MPISVSSSDRRVTRLAHPALRASLSNFVRSRVPGTEVDDIVQSALAEALAAERAPEDDDEIVAWVHGIARHKVVDWFRRARREPPQDPQVAEMVAAAESAPQSARDLLRWATRELPDGDEHERTFEWMLREGAGEKLESIAAEEELPAPRVRQRVSRLRKHYRARWAAAIAVLLALAVGAVFALRKRPKEEIAPLPAPQLMPSAVPLLPPLPESTPEDRAADGPRSQDDEKGPPAPSSLKSMRAPTAVPAPKSTMAPTTLPRPTTSKPTWTAPSKTGPKKKPESMSDAPMPDEPAR
jgi:RNA polymerase sigma factor (sigma-70 family)